MKKALILSDSMIIAVHIQRELQPLEIMCTHVATADELQHEVQDSAYDIVIVSRAHYERYGDPVVLGKVIEDSNPRAVTIVTFVVVDAVQLYAEAGFRYLYLGQPLSHFAEYVEAVLNGDPVPRFCAGGDGSWYSMDG